MKTLPDTLDLDYLCVFPGYFDAEQNKRAVEQLHALIQQGFSLAAIAELAHQHAVEHHARLLTFNSHVTSVDQPDHFHRLVSMRLYEMLSHPGAAPDFIEVVCRERVVLPARDFLMASHRHQHEASLGRDANHQVFSSKKLGFVSQSKTIIQFFMANFIRTDDLDALRVYLTVPKVKAHYPEERASVWLRSFAPASGSAIGTHFLKEKTGSIIRKCTQYAEDLKKIGQGFLSIKDYTFNQELTRKIGHEVILELMGNMRSEARELVEQLIRQGADWHLAVQMKIFGHAAYFDFVDRTVDLEAEVMHLIKNRRAVTAPFPPIVFDALGEDFMIKLAKDHGLADKLWSTWRFGYLVEHVSEKYREEILGEDLGL
jgi:hypothetical protein